MFAIKELAGWDKFGQFGSYLGASLHFSALRMGQQINMSKSYTKFSYELMSPIYSNIRIYSSHSDTNTKHLYQDRQCIGSHRSSFPF